MQPFLWSGDAMLVPRGPVVRRSLGWLLRDRWERERSLVDRSGQWWSPYPELDSEIEWSVWRRVRLLIRAALIALVIAAVFATAASGQSPPTDTISFPGAVGAGAEALEPCYTGVLQSAWPVKVWYIHPDSAATAVEGINSISDSLIVYNSATFNVVVFRRGGTMPSASQLFDDTGKFNCVLVAGQSAGTGASEGIRFLTPHDIDDDSRNIAITYTRSRSKNKKFFLTDVKNFISAHNSWSHGSGTGSGSGIAVVPTNAADSVTRLTSMYDMSAWADVDEPTCTRLGTRAQAIGIDTSTVWRSAAFGPCHRAPNLTRGRNGSYQFIGYNWKGEAAQASSHPHQNDHIGGYYKTGPSTNNNYPCPAGACAVAVDEFTDSAAYAGDTAKVYVRAIRWSPTGYVSEPIDSLWRGSLRLVGCRDRADVTDVECVTRGDTVHTVLRADNPLPLWGPYDATQMDTTALDDATLTAVLDSIGNAWGVDDDGSRVSRRDAFDSTRIAEMQDSTGLSAAIDTDTLTIADPAKGTAWTDTDSDGMPDTWETANGFNPSSAADNDDDPDADGWINLVEFLFWTDPNVFNSPDGTPSSSSSPSPTRLSWPTWTWFALAWLIFTPTLYIGMERTDRSLRIYRRVREAGSEEYLPLRRAA